jgi:hypothetical protein
MGYPTMLTPNPGQARSLNELYGYPSTTQGFAAGSADGEIHILIGTDTDPATNHGNAPNGSEYTYIGTTAASQKIWKKVGGSFGAKDGTWRYTAQLT